MNEVTNNKAAEVLQTLNEALQRSGQVVEAELPLIYEQVVAYKIATNTIWLSVTSIGVAASLYLSVKLCRLFSNSGDEMDQVYAAGLMFSFTVLVLCVFGALISGCSLLYWSVAPKAAFLDYLLHAVK